MASPFTPHTTFLPGTTPVIPADYLNQAQEAAMAFAAFTGYGAQKYWAHSFNGALINVETLHGSIVKDYALGIYTAPVLPTSPTAITVANLEPAGTFAASTWYYVYLRSNNRVAEFVISATAPGADRRWKGSDDTYRFLCSFKTTAASVIDPFTSRDGLTEYIGGGDEIHRESTIIDSTAWTTINLAFAPPHARRVHLLARISSGPTLPEGLLLLPKGVRGSIVPPASAGRIIFGQISQAIFVQIWMETDATPALEGKLIAGGVFSSGVVNVDAWQEFN